MTKERKQLSWVLMGVAVGVIVWQGTVAHENQRQLVEAEQHLELALWGSDNGLFDLTVPADRVSWDTTYAWYSDHFSELLGFDHHDKPLLPRGDAFLGRVCAADREMVTTALATAVRRKNGCDIVFQASHADGTQHWYTLRCRYSLNGHERISGTMMDITPQRQERHRADLITLSSPDAVIACGPDRRITLFNPAAVALFGVEAAEMLGRSITTIVLLEYQAAYEDAFTAAVDRLRVQPADWMVCCDVIEGEGYNAITGDTFPLSLEMRGIKYRGEMEFIATIHLPNVPAAVESVPLPTPVRAIQMARKPMRD